jgi:small GTP-binding protein
MAKPFLYDIFLSHNHADKPKVLRLAERLKAAGLKVWLDSWVVKPGDIIALKLDEGLEQSRVLLLCISPAALASGWVALERGTAIHRDPTNVGRRFIPLLLEDCELPDTLRRYKYVDYREETEDALNELMAGCRPEVEEKPQTKPPEKLVSKKQELAKTEEPEPLAVLERTLKGHGRWVNSVAVSPDGTWAVSGSGVADSKDFSVRIWDLETGECRAVLRGHTGQVRAVAITPDGKRILSASFDESVRIWDAKSGLELAKLEGHTSQIRALALFSDSKHAISGQDIDGGRVNLKIWDITSYKCLKTIQCGNESDDDIFSIVANQSGSRALSGHRDGKIRLWDSTSGECIAIFNGHSDSVCSMQTSLDGRFVVSGSDDRTIKIWDLEKGACVGTLEGHEKKIHSVAISPDDQMIASTGFIDETIRLWDLQSGTCLLVINDLTKASPISVAFSPDGTRLVAGTIDGPIYVYRLSTVNFIPPAETPRRYMNAKVVLLGEGTVGKTSLAHRLIEDKYVVKDRTHGMNVWRLDLPIEKADSLEKEALLWDLAGQEDYRLIHRLFLEQTSLALLLVNPQNEDPFKEAGDWLKGLQTAANGAVTEKDLARLLVFSQIDVGGMKLGNAKIERFIEQHGFAGWLATSAKTGENCSDAANDGKPSTLKELIAKSIPWDKLPWTSTPKLLADLKNAVMAMQDGSDIRLLRFSELAQRLEQALPGEPMTISDIRTAVALLANHGLVRPFQFGDLVLLLPDLINGYASAVIRAARAHTDEIGCVAEAAIYAPDFDFTGIEQRLQRPDEELLLRALVQIFLDHSLCIAEDTPQGRHLVFPSQYRREKDTPKHPDIFVSYTFSGEWQTVWTTLVVRLWYSQEFGHRELWCNAAEFETSKNQTLGLLIQKEGDGIAKISLYFDMAVPDELKVIFIEYVHRHLDKYACEVTRDRRFLCPACTKPVTDLEAVRQRMQDGKDFITCQKCDGKVPFVDFIEQRLKSDPVARKILAMEETATRELDTQALEQILIGHMMAIAGEANQIFRPVTMFDHGIDGEVEFKDDDGNASGKKIYIQLKSGNSYLRTRKSDGQEIFDVHNERHFTYWISQPVDVYLVIRQKDEMTGESVIRWMNVTEYLNQRNNKKSRQLVFAGEKLDMEAVYRVRDKFFKV